MSRPGVDVEVVDDVDVGGAILDTGQGFMFGATERGPEVGLARSLADYKNKWGSRAGGSLMYDSVNAFFTEGGNTAVVSRQYPANAVKATITQAGSWKIDAVSGGAWGNDIDVDFVYAAGPGTAGDPIRLVVKYQNLEVERSTVIRSNAEGVSWAQDSAFIRLSSVGANLPAGGTTAALASGAAGTGSATDVDDALARYTYEMGPGQVGTPGNDDPLVHAKIAQHCQDYHRVGIVDLEETDDPLVLEAAIGDLNNDPNSKLLLAMGHWLNYPFETDPAQVVIPYSGAQMGIIARVDKGGDPAAVAAGAKGISRRALGVTKEINDADRERLNELGITFGRQMLGLVRTYGYRTAAGPDYKNNWTFFQESRVVMAVAHECNAAVEEYVFNTIDGFGHLFIKVKNVLVGICQKYWQAGALYGANPSDGFRVVTGSEVNTIDTIKRGEIHAAVYLKTSKVAEWVKVNIIKVPTESQV